MLLILAYSQTVDYAVNAWLLITKHMPTKAV